nr:immunoglobulin heavy chain junction region [Macaca mulatta]MOY18740.1 immunoglobulin heavy chain junction region [Macaca mulatta]MOY19739.1 immunoglobulin heavy chain junction region [Macaca mulatta]MOY20524.1 immunoglobulin heavy chain junction region [Macaca mulatta]
CTTFTIAVVPTRLSDAW